MFEPELSQLMWGTQWAQYGVPQQVGDMLYELSEKLIDDINASPCYGVDYVNDVFEMHPYYWGTCTCGFEDEEIEWEETHPHKPNCFHVKYEKYKEELEKKDITPFGKTKIKYDKLMTQFAKENGYTGLEGIAVYCDCGVDEEYEKWRETHDHKPDCPIVRPNFLYKPTGLIINWYKYINRSMSSNQIIDPKEFRKIIDHCLESAKDDIKKAEMAKNKQKVEERRWRKEKRKQGFLCQDCIHFLGETQEGKVYCSLYTKEQKEVENNFEFVKITPVYQDYRTQCQYFQK